MNQLITSILSDINVCLPGVVQTYNGKTVTAKPALPKQLANGQTLAAPLIVAVPVCWPIADAGQAMITVPLKPGDPVVLHFSQRSLENWLSGSDQAPDDPRQFDLSDAFATPVMRPGPVADTENLTVQYGPGSMKLAPDGSLTVRVPRQHVIAQETIFDSPVTVNGLLTYTAGMAGSGGSGNSISISGGASFEGGTIMHDGKNIGSDHRHSGVQTGGGTTGGPV